MLSTFFSIHEEIKLKHFLYLKKHPVSKFSSITFVNNIDCRIIKEKSNKYSNNIDCRIIKEESLNNKYSNP